MTEIYIHVTVDYKQTGSTCVDLVAANDRVALREDDIKVDLDAQPDKITRSGC
jgi:hypothetical protein